jgi:hypothetical protein
MDSSQHVILLRELRFQYVGNQNRFAAFGNLAGLRVRCVFVAADIPFFL